MKKRKEEEEEEKGAGCLKVPKRARKRDKGRPAGIIDAGTRRDGRERPGPRGPAWIEGGRRGSPGSLFTRGTKTDAKPKAGACKKGQQVDGVSGLSG